jgi:hypothetical protein
VLIANYLKGYYTLEDLNSLEIRGIVLGVRLKLYHVRARHIPSVLYGEQDFRLFKEVVEASE